MDLHSGERAEVCRTEDEEGIENNAELLN